MNISELFLAFGASAEGLSDEEVGHRHARYGLNTLPKIPLKPWYLKLAAQFTHFFALLLWTAAAISFATGMADPASHMLSIGWAIVIVIGLNVSPK